MATPTRDDAGLGVVAPDFWGLHGGVWHVVGAVVFQSDDSRGLQVWAPACDPSLARWTVEVVQSWSYWDIVSERRRVDLENEDRSGEPYDRKLRQRKYCRRCLRLLHPNGQPSIQWPKGFRAWLGWKW